MAITDTKARTTKAYKLYKYSELDERAKARARNWYLDSLADENWWWTDAADYILELLRDDTGLNLDTEDVEFSYSSSQGDYAKFNFDWTPVTEKMLKVARVNLGNVDLEGITVRSTGSGHYNSVEVDMGPLYDGGKYTDEEVIEAEEALDDFADKFSRYLDDQGDRFLRTVSDEWSALENEENVEDFMDGNEYLFTQFGDYAQTGY